MANISNLKNILVPNKTVEVEFPGMPGFVINVAFLTREIAVGLRKKASKTVYKNRQAVEEFDDELFTKLYVSSTIKGWKGLTVEYLQKLAPIATDLDPKTEVDYSEENALDLMRSSSDFDSFITETVTDLGNFSKNSQKI